MIMITGLPMFAKLHKSNHIAIHYFNLRLNFILFLMFKYQNDN